jgi:hypothetical protein
MPKTMTQVRCPNCKSPIQAAIEQLIDVGQDPAAKARLLSGGLNLIRCPNCRYEGQLATPLVYHDPSKEMLLTYVPVEIGLKKDDQERLLGQLINQAVSHLTPEQRKGYLLQPQAMFTLQGLVERVLAADGITKEDLEAQRAKIRLFEDLLRTPEADLATFATQHDLELDEMFFQLASLTLQTTPDDRAREAASMRLEKALEFTSYGKRLDAQESEARAAADSLRQASKDLTRAKLLDLFVEAPNVDRVAALASMTRPALDYGFFQELSDRLQGAAAPEKERLGALRQSLLELTQEYDRLQEARVSQAAALLKSIAAAPDLEKAVAAALPLIDDLFFGVLAANLRAARERGDAATVTRLEAIDEYLQKLVRESLPPGLRLAQKLLDEEDEAAALKLLEASPELVDDKLTGSLMAAAQRLEEAGEASAAERVRRMHRQAIRLSMKTKMGQAGTPEAQRTAGE